MTSDASFSPGEQGVREQVAKLRICGSLESVAFHLECILILCSDICIFACLGTRFLLEYCNGVLSLQLEVAIILGT